MSNKRQKQLMHKLVCFSLLEIELLDELNATTEIIKTHKDNLIAFHEELIRNIADTSTMQKSTYFNEMSTKIDTIIRRNFDENM